MGEFVFAFRGLTSFTCRGFFATRGFFYNSEKRLWEAPKQSSSFPFTFTISPATIGIIVIVLAVNQNHFESPHRNPLLSLEASLPYLHLLPASSSSTRSGGLLAKGRDIEGESVGPWSYWLDGWRSGAYW